MKKRAVFLDRDGVINSYFHDPEFGTVDSPLNPHQFTLLPGVAKAIRTFNRKGFLVLVVSNQPGIAKGKFSSELLQAITKKMKRSVREGGGRIDGVYYCLHHPQAPRAAYRKHCDCRKPLPGLLKQAAADWDVDLERSYMVGDGSVDVLAGNAAGTTTVFLAPRKLYIRQELERVQATPDYWVADLSGAAKIIATLERGTHSTQALRRVARTANSQ
jgi:D-glycero-D-manno-heptose 1,7-bisphosphate phosphatase